MGVPYSENEYFNPIGSMIPEVSGPDRPTTQPSSGDFSSSFWRGSFPDAPPAPEVEPYVVPGGTYEQPRDGGGPRNRMRWDYVPPTGGLDPSQRFDEYMTKLSADQAILDKERARQVGRSGASAAAPYDRAIAKINAEIVRIREQKVQAAQIAEAQQTGITSTFEAARVRGAELAPQQDAQIDAAFGVQTQESAFAIKTSVPAAQIAASATSAAMSPEATTALVEATSAIQDDVMSYTELVAKNTREYVDAAQKILEQSFTLEEAMRGTDLTYEREIMQAQMQQEIENMIAEKEELQAKRAAAVSSARNATLASFKEGLESGQEGFMNLPHNQFVQDLLASGKMTIDQIPIYEAFVELSQQSPIWDESRNLREVGNLRELFFPGGFEANPAVQEAELAKLPDAAQALYNMLDTTVPDGPARRDFMYLVIEGTKLDDESKGYYNTQIVNSDPTSFQPGSLNRAYSSFEQEMRAGALSGIGPWEAWEYAQSEAAHLGYNNPNQFAVDIPGVY